MNIEFLTIFPELFTGFVEVGLIRQGRDRGIIQVQAHDLRNFTHDRHRTVDDISYGGGPGMVFKPEPVFEAVDALKGRETVVLLPTPQGEVFTQQIAEELAQRKHLLFICARYEGVDERICEELVDRELSIGDFVTMGGELPAMIMTEAIVRFVPGVVGEPQSVKMDSFQSSLLDYPHYTRPENFRDLKVPQVLLSGHHDEIRKWRRKMAIRRTLMRRPELLDRAQLSEEDLKLLAEVRVELKSN